MRSAMSSALRAPQHAFVGVAALQSSERGEIAQILFDREIEIERRLLEHDAERSKRLGTPLCRRLAANLDTALWRVEQPVMSENSVDLPAPFGPSSAVTLPG